MSAIREQFGDTVDVQVLDMKSRVLDPDWLDEPLRRYRPDRLVHARLELSTGGLLRGREVGIDVMGDGGLVPYTGVVRKRELEPADDETAFDAVREALSRDH